MDDFVKLFGVLTAIGAAGGVVYAIFAVVGAVTRRLDGRPPAVEPDDLEYLRDRAEQVDLLEQRLADLETRVDFAERLLTRPVLEEATPNADRTPEA